MSPIPGHKMSPVQPAWGSVLRTAAAALLYCTRPQTQNSPSWAMVTVAPRINPTVCKIKVLCRMWNSTGETVRVYVYIYTSVYAHMYSYIHLCIGVHVIHRPSSVISAKKQRKQYNGKD